MGKIGGDKGGSTLKASFQLCNVPRPNSVQNTCVFAVFEARDSPSNLHIALDRYNEQIRALQTTEWRYELLTLWLIVFICKCLPTEERKSEYLCSEIMSSCAVCMALQEHKVNVRQISCICTCGVPLHDVCAY